jgi:peptidoglycan/LPS O-acetylase OafA/YrhL
MRSVCSRGYTGLLRPLRLVSDGRLGVLVFFVLSGFLITSILQAELKSTGRIRLFPFYVKRALRIWPAFYTYLATIVVLSMVGWTDVDRRQFMVAALHLWNYSGLGGMSADSEVDPQKRTPILLKKEVPKWANIVPRTRRNSGRKWLSW